MPRRSSRSLTDRLSHSSPVILVLIALAGLAVTAWATSGVLESEHQRKLGELSERIEQVSGTVRGHYAKYETLLHAGRALFAGSDFVSETDWALFTGDVMAGQKMPGLVGLSWVAFIDDPVGMQRLSNEKLRAGRPPLVIRPPGDRPFYCLIVYNEPSAENATSIGRDVCTVDALQDPLRLTREQPSVFLSEPLRLVRPDGGFDPGVVMLIRVEGDSNRHTGWIGASLRLSELFGSPDPTRDGGGFEVLDITGGERFAESVYGELPDDDSLLGRVLQVERTLEAGGRTFRMTLAETGRATWAAGMVLLAGLVSTALLVAYLLTLFRTREQARALAARTSGQLEENERLLASITDNIFEGIYRGQPDAGLVYANESLARMFGYDGPEAMLENAGPILYARPEQRDELLERLQRDGFYRDVEVEFIRADGSRFVGVNNAVAHFDGDWNVEYFDGAIYDITERKEAEAQVHRLAHYDILTGLPNRAMLDRRLRQAIHHAESVGQSMALLFMDLDHFKTINDSLGHSLGDELLVQVAKRLGSGLRSEDSVSRLGGDEFLILLADVDAEGAARGATRILDLFTDPFVLEGHELRVSPSIGISMFPDDAVDAEVLIRNADAAMYAAKERGRANYQFFVPEMNARARERLTLESDLRQALRTGRLSLHYQPVVRIADREVIGAEALLRWSHPELGDIPPARFIPIAEQSGLIVEIGDWVIGEACRQLAEWMRAGLPPLPVAVNVSALQFWRGGLVDQVRNALDAHSLDAELLELELTESVIMRDAEIASRVISLLNGLGVRLSIDDFGTGYSSLSYLKKFSISKLKIDQSFVQDLGHDPDDAAIVSAIISMAEDLGLEVVAEGVETDDQRRLLQARGCALAQGFLFDRPMTAEAFLERFRESRRIEPPSSDDSDRD
ncbi:EAL domain-containing protein [Wenzhouxiangella sp. XN79A]|uniref:bifunctional diguanylate cyclase/phosphodiesterase n=1 Tax=Wenzhouxiangella sp. XN79A TaxID=2724193 RepID=UPI00144A5E52|nr:EAL domain-containing protein [Wenzhouxiangella sp. XN79A]NKI35188.1 EAL domain-containing protein [Wenzhouxiangella sp. XN79A]